VAADCLEGAGAAIIASIDALLCAKLASRPGELRAGDWSMDGTGSVPARYTGSSLTREESHMLKIVLAVAAAATALTVIPLAIPANAQGVKMAQGVDVQIGRDRDDRYYRDDRDRYRYDRDTTVGVGPGGVTIGPRQHCRTVTTTVERDDGRMVTRKERRCD
jgi:hypothetical protein